MKTDMVTISREAREELVTEQDVIDRQAERQTLKEEIQLLEYAIRERQKRISHITAQLCLIQLAASHQLYRRQDYDYRTGTL